VGVRLLCFAALVVAFIVAMPGLGSIRSRLAHENPTWLAFAAVFRFLSTLAYVVLFRAIFAPGMSGDLRSFEDHPQLEPGR